MALSPKFSSVGILLFLTSTSLWAEFSLSEIPPISNKTPITLVAETGFWTDYLQTQMLPAFTMQTGIDVKVVSTPLDNMFSLQQTSLRMAKGEFDLLSMEAGWAKEWAANGYTVPLEELAGLYDPGGAKAMAHYLEPYYPALLSILSYRGEVHAIPYNNYVMGNHFRRDLFENADEKTHFAERYGYPLEAPTTLAQLKDIAEFFTRKPGDLLAGKLLKQPFYGVALMSGNKPHINDEFSAILWSMGGRWLTPVYEDNGRLHHFDVSRSLEKKLQVADYYQSLKRFAIPADDAFAFNEAADALANGRVAMWPFAYNNLWYKSAVVEKKVEGARLGVAQVAGGKPYVGAYAFAVSYDSRNPEAAYWLLKYMGSFQAQYDYAMGGGNPCRMDVATHTDFQNPALKAIGGAFLASHQANLAWAGEIRTMGHFTSSVMGQIYPELAKTCFAVSRQPNHASQYFGELNHTILELQNSQGETAAMEK
ncbi:extracellular solute-binding protein [Shewanella sp. FJAT-52076]|uniref:extracellular solute-binding protein n=1 Tax=Shewanella sp. FJAT-52076 TaxID=2864202 RepID=UPI0021AC9F4C|nr:extracellular solute-binding protein [Shewanella sp. FJAT-52076]